MENPALASLFFILFTLAIIELRIRIGKFCKKTRKAWVKSRNKKDK